MTVETGIIVSSAASPTGRAVVLVIIYVETFITDGIVLAVASYNVRTRLPTISCLYVKHITSNA